MVSHLALTYHSLIIRSPSESKKIRHHHHLFFCGFPFHLMSGLVSAPDLSLPPEMRRRAAAAMGNWSPGVDCSLVFFLYSIHFRLSSGTFRLFCGSCTYFFEWGYFPSVEPPFLYFTSCFHVPYRNRNCVLVCSVLSIL